MVLVEDVFESEGEISLGVRLDQVVAVSSFPAQIEFVVYLEVRLDGDDTADVDVAVALKNEQFEMPFGSGAVRYVPRGDDWPFPADIPLAFPVSVAVPVESWAMITAQIGGDVRAAKWLRVVGFPVLGS